MKSLINTFCLGSVIILLTAFTGFSKPLYHTNISADSTELITQYSLFSEYYKNHDYKSALPFGWKVLKMDPEKFSRWIYYKMEDILWYMHDSSNAPPQQAKEIADTLVYVYDMAMKYHSGDKGYFQSKKAYVMELWLNVDPAKAIKEYQLAFQYDPNLSSYYYNLLGQLYKKYASDKNDYKEKAIDLYTMLSEKESDNPEWTSQLESLVDNIDQLVALSKKAWDFDKDNLAKAWKYASMAIRANEYEKAIEPLEFLVSKSPTTVNYWNQLATAYQKTDKFDKAEMAYKKLIAIEPENKNHYLNLGIILSDKGQFAAARYQFQKANEVAKGWAQAIYYEGLLYEKAARGCEFNFETKLVYQLAVNTYRKAYSVDPTFTQAKNRINALSGSVPTKEDYFFRKYKSGQTIPITGNCYSWIGRSITVP